MDLTPQVEKQVITVNGVPSLLAQIQPYNYDLTDCRKAVVVIPGNPGIIKFYDGFMKCLYEKCEQKWPVYGIQHAGHGTLHHSNSVLSSKPFNLTEQIDHKIAFIEKHFPNNCQLILIGHSIGAYIVLKIMEHFGQKHDKIVKGILLFPTIERMAASPNGRIATPVSNYFSWPMIVGSWFLSCLPDTVKKYVVIWWFSKRNVDEECTNAVLELITANGIRSMLYMAADEMEKVDKTPVQLIEDHIDKLIFYYGATDLWTPANYHTEMKHRFPNAQIYVCSKGIKHAFVLESHDLMAEIVTTWLLEKKKK